MADADTVAGLRRVAQRLRGRGIDVREVPGWERRGKGPMRPQASVEHHTASRRGGDWGALLRLLTYGHGDLDNAICNWGVPANGHAAYLVCAGLAYHAGSGSWRGVSGNSRSSGTEWQNDGQGEPADPRAVEVMAAISQEMAREFGYSAGFVCEHFEWTNRKVDRRAPGLPVGQAWRDRLTHHPPPAPSPSQPVTTDRRAHMYALMRDRSTNHVWAVHAGNRHRWHVPNRAVLDALVNSGLTLTREPVTVESVALTPFREIPVWS